MAQQSVAVKRERLEEAEAAQQEWECPICLSGSSVVVLVPCGHRVCEGAACLGAQAVGQACSTCRQPITGHQRLY